MIEERRPIAACHQPNFFPWLGYFHKIRWSDTFVFLDDVLLQKTRGSVTNRASFVVGGAATWVTAPLDRSYHGNLAIRDVRFAPADRWRDKFSSTLKMHYRRSPHFEQLAPSLLELVENPESSMAEYNIRAITTIAEMLGLSAKLVRASAYDVRETSSLRLAELVRKVGAKTYLAGAGARAYQDDDVFKARGLSVLPQGFVPPTYLRGGSPSPPGLSVVDALLWLGIEGTRALLESPPSATIESGSSVDASALDEDV
jgi:hypothetical protein